MFDLIKKITGKFNESMKKEIDIEYDLSDCYISVYGDAYGVVRKRKSYLNNPNTKSYSYFATTIFRLVLILLINIFCFWGYAKNGYTDFICFLMCCLPFLYLILAIDIIGFIIKVSCPKRLKGRLRLTPEGLIDYSIDGVRMLFEWRKVKMIVIKKNAIVILTDTPCYFLVNPELERQLIGEIKRFNNDIVIVRQYN